LCLGFRNLGCGFGVGLAVGLGRRMKDRNLRVPITSGARRLVPETPRSAARLAPIEVRAVAGTALVFAVRSGRIGPGKIQYQ
jgi:hypothetical protein